MRNLQKRAKMKQSKMVGPKLNETLADALNCGIA